MIQSLPIFGSPKEDFFKIFFPTLILVLLLPLDFFWKSQIFLLTTIFFLDGGHVYSTYVESLADPTEVKKGFVWKMLGLSFFLNLAIHLFISDYFFTYIFYFTVFHNMRQGLGLTFLYRMGQKSFHKVVKFSYYFLTVVPFILFHFRGKMREDLMGESILSPIFATTFLSTELTAQIFSIGVWLFGLGTILIFCYFALKKEWRGVLTMIFFGSLYTYSFIFSQSELKSYGLLIFSHAIPYFFLMEKRVSLTHSVGKIKKFAYVFIFLSFFFGGLLDYYQDDLVILFEPFESVGLALLLTPLIGHFLIDAFIWKRDHLKFKHFNQSRF